MCKFWAEGSGGINKFLLAEPNRLHKYKSLAHFGKFGTFYILRILKCWGENAINRLLREFLIRFLLFDCQHLKQAWNI